MESQVSTSTTRKEVVFRRALAGRWDVSSQLAGTAHLRQGQRRAERQRDRVLMTPVYP